MGTNQKTASFDVNEKHGADLHKREYGFCLAVVDNGFVYIGDLHWEEGYYILTNCHNVRKSGTDRGFGQLAYEGPRRETALDPCPPVLVPEGRMCHIMETADEPWQEYRVKGKRG